MINNHHLQTHPVGSRSSGGHLAMAPTAPVSSTQMQDNHVSSSSETESGVQSRQNSDDSQQLSNNDGGINLEKEKTPMCLVNELARFNKIEHQYRLTNEEGPPHKKKFTVTLKFGNEEYTADGASIKKAQHAAASIALMNTMYKHPPPKSSRSQRGAKSNITPTVELNALAMKRGEPTTYTLVESPMYNRPPYVGHCYRRMYNQPYPEYGFDRFGHTPRGKFDLRGGRGNYNYRMMEPGYYGSTPPLYKVLAKVGDREFYGEGTTAQAARHEAASKALQVLKNLPVEDSNSCTARNVTCDGVVDSDSSTELKSPISLVHEIALKRNLPVLFEVISEKGQPHMRTFVTRCTVGDKFESIGEGNGKKVSKKRAAENMLELLRTLPPTTTVTATGFVGSLSRMKRKPNANKKKSRNLIKDTTASTGSSQDNQKTESEVVEDMNPISRLIHIQQAKREKEPVYTLREERGMSRQRVFVMEVKMGEHSCTGSGSNKKIAKRKAAEGLLQQLGYISPTVNRTGHPLPQQHSQQQQTNKQVRFSDEKPASSAGGSVGRQLVPGLLLMKDNKASNGNPNAPHKGMALKTATIAKEYLSNGNSPTADALAGNKRPKAGPVVRPTDQLLYLAQVLNFQIQFSDFPKGNHSEFLSLVSVATDPPQVCHGSGATIDLSHDQAALNALRCLSEMGLDSISPAKKEQTNNIPPPSAQTENLYLNLGHIPKEDSYVNGK
uniref:DRBM domain-containing protein n=6 Tax=Lygus hesperus TaxID=30085 RepID=A0A0A9YH86_LYGHE